MVMLLVNTVTLMNVEIINNKFLLLKLVLKRILKYTRNKYYNYSQMYLVRAFRFYPSFLKIIMVGHTEEVHKKIKDYDLKLSYFKCLPML